METVPQKVKNVIKRRVKIVTCFMTLLLFGSWQLKNPKSLTDDQYQLLNDIFKRKTQLYYQTATLKSWTFLINKKWLENESVGCSYTDENAKNRIIEDLTEEAFLSKLESYRINQRESSVIKQIRLNPERVKIINNDKSGTAIRISAPLIFEEKGLLYYQSVNSESIYYLKKDQNGKWQIICNFIIYAVFN